MAMQDAPPQPSGSRGRPGRPAPAEATVRFNLWLPEALHAAIVELATAADRPIAGEYRRALAAWIERHAEQLSEGSLSERPATATGNGGAFARPTTTDARTVRDGAKRTAA